MLIQISERCVTNWVIRDSKDDLRSLSGFSQYNPKINTNYCQFICGKASLIGFAICFILAGCASEMRNIRKSTHIVITSIITIFFLGLTACSTVQLQKVTIQPASSYKFSSSKAGLIISVDPFIEEDRVNKFFGYDLLSKGILPVLVVFENKSAEDGYILLNERTMLLMKDQVIRQNPKDNTIGNINSSGELEKSANVQNALGLGAQASLTAGAISTAAGATSQLSGTALGVAGFVVFLIPVAIVGHHEGNLLRSQENVIENEMTNNRTLYNGASNSGFLYLKIDQKENLRNIVGFMFHLKNIRTDEVQSIIVETK